MVRLICKKLTQAPFIWSRVPKTALPQVTLGKLFFTSISLKSSTSRFMRITNLSRGGKTTRPPELAGRETLAGKTIFLHISSANCRYQA